MEKFMLLFRGGEEVYQLSPQEQQAHMQKWFAWVDKLTKAGRYVAGEPLLPEGKVVSGASKPVTDGPYSESKEVIGGFFIVEAKDFQEASEMAKDCPDFEYGGFVEVRQVMKMDIPT